MDILYMVQETLEIIADNQYELDGKIIRLSQNPKDFEAVKVYREDDVRNAVESMKKPSAGTAARVIVDNLDSFVSAQENGEGKTCVLNFADAYVPGGMFLEGANAQEEILCRCSTLYASLSSKQASWVYEYNNGKNLPGGSDCILYSPHVTVFRHLSYPLLDKPHEVSVITSAAPNLYLDGRELVVNYDALREVMLRKIKNLLAVAYDNKADTLVLGAWGCGVFGHDPTKMADFFYHVLVDEGYMNCFKKIVFSIYSPRGTGRNYLAFKERFADICES